MKLLSCHIENFGSIRGETLQFDGALTAFLPRKRGGQDDARILPQSHVLRHGV